MDGDWIIRNITVFASRLSPQGRAIQEDELRKLSKETLKALWLTLQDAEQQLQAERRTWRPFPGGPRIRG